MVMVRVEVTQQDIDHGRRESCDECPGALAIKRHMVRVRYFEFEVGCDEIYFIPSMERKTTRLVRATPPELSRFITRFDDTYFPRWDFEPFSFYLDIPNHLYIGAGE
jgi:hypothetical protein